MGYGGLRLPLRALRQILTSHSVFVPVESIRVVPDTARLVKKPLRIGLRREIGTVVFVRVLRSRRAFRHDVAIFIARHPCDDLAARISPDVPLLIAQNLGVRWGRSFHDPPEVPVAVGRLETERTCENRK